MTRQTPPWLAELQARFGSVIRTPLDRASGTLTATPSAYDPGLVELTLDGRGVSGAERLAIYNRQYWFRLFEVLQAAFPLTTRLLGHWTFNGYASRFLEAQPPRGWDVDLAAQGFESFLAEDLRRQGAPDREAIGEGACIDAAWLAVFRAPRTVPLRPTPSEAPTLLDAKLSPSPAVALIEEHWPLLELRQRVLGDISLATIPLPAPLPAPRWWVLVRSDEGTRQLPLARREAQLLELLRTYPVREALARLELACTPEEREFLPAQAQAWLGRGLQLGFWVKPG